MAITHRDVGRWVTLSGKTRHGKNRISEHGERWLIKEVKVFQGAPAMILESENDTFSIRSREAAKTKEWTTHKTKDSRWVLLRNDPNFLYFW